jgi:hypothetical protein
MHHEHRSTYPPLNTLKEVADDVWIIDGPLIRFGWGWFKFPFSTRATILRLAAGDLLVHSPTPLVPTLAAAIEKIGTPRWLVGPNRLHYSWIGEWHAAYPDAAIYLAPKTELQGSARLGFAWRPLDRDGGYPWDDRVETLVVAGGYMTEVEFFHRPSRTLVLTDLIENFETDKLETAAMRFWTRVGGVRDPDGAMPRDMRLSFVKHKRELKAAVRRMMDWNPERIILAHGRWYNANGRAELQRSFRWILDA